MDIPRFYITSETPNFLSQDFLPISQGVPHRVAIGRRLQEQRWKKVSCVGESCVQCWEVAPTILIVAAGHGGAVAPEQHCVAPSSGDLRVCQPRDQCREVALTKIIEAAGRGGAVARARVALLDVAHCIERRLLQVRRLHMQAAAPLSCRRRTLPVRKVRRVLCKVVFFLVRRAGGQACCIVTRWLFRFPTNMLVDNYRITG